MRFRLLYEGNLYSSQPNDPYHPKPSDLTLSQHKHEIRKQFHKQLKLVFQNHAVLSNFKYCTSCQQNHAFEPPDDLSHEFQRLEEFIIAKTPPLNTLQFCPLVSDVLELNCSLNILILRHDAKAGVYRAGDLDNRLKTLIDGLAKPASDGYLKTVQPARDETPFFVLLNDDNIISGLKVETDILHKDEDNNGIEFGKSYVFAIIEVEIKPSNPNHVNLGFF